MSAHFFVCVLASLIILCVVFEVEVDVCCACVAVVSTEQSANKKALKIIKVQERGISVLTTTDRSVLATIDRSVLTTTHRSFPTITYRVSVFTTTDRSVLTTTDRSMFSQPQTGQFSQPQTGQCSHNPR